MPARRMPDAVLLTKKQPGVPRRPLQPARPGAETIRTQRRSKPEEVRRCTARRDMQGRGAVAWDNRSCRTRAARGQRSNNRRLPAQADEEALSAAATERPQRLPGSPFSRFERPPFTYLPLARFPSSSSPAGFSLPRAGIRVVGASFVPSKECLHKVSATTSEPEDFESPEEVDDLEQVEEVEVLEDEDDEETVALAPDEEEEGAASLDELLAQRAASRRGSDDADDDDDIMALATERHDKTTDIIVPRVVPIQDRAEFVCDRCHLVKAKSQLADAQRGLCRDCV
jgi:hypothetical protein